ncbi:gamma-glutamylcyclotransferase [Terasakiella pusilla]|uniref:gamma-glutamylcyclotransferase n=1 Tax=Terasakiella pusilla TaxID=64973 RepID=UPI003AA83586
MAREKELWVFGYGSLMWSPGFEYEQVCLATLAGYHRDLCVLSYVFRGTPEVPGIVMGLRPGGHCQGRAFKISAKDEADVMAYLQAREMINNVYDPCWLEITLEDGRRCPAYTFVARRDHDQYVGDEPQHEKVRLVLQGFGQGGSALEYLDNTCTHLRDLLIRDAALETILQVAQQQKAQKGEEIR